eukprot:COSAG05_NODE_4077_length_1684_cov_13.816601_1_plen_72_part_10
MVTDSVTAARDFSVFKVDLPGWAGWGVGRLCGPEMDPRQARKLAALEASREAAHLSLAVTKYSDLFAEHSPE